jgi:hypothetical protein
MTDAPLASVELRVSDDSGRWGRAFLPVDVLRTIRVEELAAAFDRAFIEQDDLKRFALLERALAFPSVTVEIYPGETPPQEFHIYFRVPSVSDDPIFACVLAPPSVVRELASRAPHVVFETASFQATDGAVSNASIASAVDTWARRVWPELHVPTLLLSPWPAHVGAADTVAALYKLRQFPPPTVGKISGGPETFSPPSDLVGSEAA